MNKEKGYTYFTAASSGVLLLLLIVCLFIYYPGLSGGFYFDDTWNIQNNSNIKIESFNLEQLTNAALSGESGINGRPVSMLSFAVNHLLFGEDAFYYKLVNLIIHQVNAVLVYLIVCLLVTHINHPKSLPFQSNKALWIGLSVALFWALNPLNLSTVLYSVQRMAGLSAMFCLMGMLAYVMGRHRLNTQSGFARILILSCFILFLPLAFLSKESGALLALYILVLEVCIFSREAILRWNFVRTGKLVAIPAMVFTLICVVYLLNGGLGVFEAYKLRDFTLWERVLTETRIVWKYIFLSIIPQISQMGLFHDDVRLSGSLIEPLTTLFSLVGHIALIFFAIYKIRRIPLVSFGVLFFYIGHSLESTILPLELMHEHRNYLPQVGIWIAVSCLLFDEKIKNSMGIIKPTILCVAVLFAFTTFVRASSWGDPLVFSVSEVTHHPDSPRANYQMGRIHASMANSAESEFDRKQHFILANIFFTKSAELSEHYNDGLFGLAILFLSNGQELEAQKTNLLLRRLSEQTVSYNDVNQISNLTNCMRQNYCQDDVNLVRLIIEAALANDRLTSGQRLLINRHNKNWNNSHGLISGD